MRGFPLLQSILVMLAVIVAGVPVYRLTRPARAEAAVVSTMAQPTGDVPGVVAQTTPVDVEAVFAPAPTDFQIKTLDQTVLTGSGPKTRFTSRWVGSVPPEGVDFVVQVHWPAATGTDVGVVSAAARIAVRFPDGQKVEKSFWADANGTLTDVFTLPGAAQPTGTP